MLYFYKDLGSPKTKLHVVRFFDFFKLRNLGPLVICHSIHKKIALPIG